MDHQKEDDSPEASSTRFWAAVSRRFEGVRGHLVDGFILWLAAAGGLLLLQVYFAGTPLLIWVTTHHAAVLAISVVAASATPAVWKVFRHFIPKLAKRCSSVARGSGLEEFLPHKPPQRARREWAECASRITAEMPDRLRILAFTGAATFAHEDSPLRDALSKHTRYLEILVVLPGTTAFEQRIRRLQDPTLQVAVRRQRYYAELDDTREFCRSLASKPVNELQSIEVRGYQLPAIWKMVMFGNYLWLQHYWHSKPVDRTSAYIFRERGNVSLFTAYQGVFDSYWASSTLLLVRRCDGSCEDNWQDWAEPTARVRSLP